MIEFSYSPNYLPKARLSFAYPGSGLCFFSGLKAEEIIDILSLKGLLKYSGFFRVNGFDLLDFKNPKRDFYPIAHIKAHDKSYERLSSQVPEEGVLETDAVDVAVEKYLQRYEVDEELQDNFLALLRAVYEELSAHAAYVLLDLSEVNRGFCYAIVDLLGKVLSSREIYVYAPGLLEYPNYDINFYKDIKQFVDEKEAPNPSATSEEIFKRQAMTSFLTDLHLEEGGGKRRRGVSLKIKKPPREKLFLWLSNLCSLLSIAPLIVLYAVGCSATPFVICILLNLILTLVAMGFLVVCNGAKAEKHVYQNRFLTLSMIFFTVALSFNGFYSLGFGIGLSWRPEAYYFVLPIATNFGFALSLWAAAYFGNHVLFGNPTNGGK